MTEVLSSQLTHSWELLMRNRLIEVTPMRDRRLTTNHFCNSLQIKRKQASKDINRHNNEGASGGLVLNRIKGFRPSDIFKPLFTRGIADSFSHSLLSRCEITRTDRRLALGFAPTKVFHPLVWHVIHDNFLALVYTACTAQKIDMGSTLP